MVVRSGSYEEGSMVVVVDALGRMVMVSVYTVVWVNE